MPIMKLIPATVFLAFGLLSGLYGQDPSLTKDQIIERSWKAMFGNLKPKNVRTIYCESYFHGREEPGIIYIKRPNLYRNESKEAIIIFDGEKGALITASEKGDETTNMEIVDTAYWAHFEVDIALIFPAFFEYPAIYRGINSTGAIRSYEVYVDLPLGGHVTYFIDPESFLVRRRLVSWEGDPDQELWENLITGYLNYNGLLFQEGYSFMGREGREEGYFRNVRYNSVFKESLFRIK